MENENPRSDKLFCISAAFIFVVLAYLGTNGAVIIRLNIEPNWFFLGLLLSVHGGAIFTSILNFILEKYDSRLRKQNKPNVPSCLTGFIERFIFTAVIGFAGTDSLPYVGALMGGWLGLKLAANWQQRHDEFARARGILALINGLISLFFALIGGLITGLK
jgi:hypothetical protein